MILKGAVANLFSSGLCSQSEGESQSNDETSDNLQDSCDSDTPTMHGVLDGGHENTTPHFHSYVRAAALATGVCFASMEAVSLDVNSHFGLFSR